MIVLPRRYADEVRNLTADTLSSLDALYDVHHFAMRAWVKLTVRTLWANIPTCSSRVDSPR